MRALIAVVVAVAALALLSVASLAGANGNGGRQNAVAVGGVHDVTAVDHHWTTVHLGR